MATKKDGGWFLRRSYNHLDYPLNFAAATKLVCDKQAVAKRQFLPLIGYIDEKRRFRTDNSNRTIPRKLRPKIISTKQREIKYAAHGDAAVYQFYAFEVGKYYDLFLKKNDLDESVIGYRSGKGSNVDMAAEVFSEIASRKHITALCFDVENFFPTIQHKTLKIGLLRVLDVPVLPDDWYQVYRSLAKFAWIEIKDLALLEGFNPKDPPFPLVTDINSALDRCRSAKALHRNRLDFGIPQGTPLSAMAANIAMVEFDLDIYHYVQSVGGIYRRYSDDILILVPPQFEATVEDLVIQVAGRNGLSINSSKTEISRFSVQQGQQVADRPIAYLGFCFDGVRTFLRPSTLSRYYRRMTYAARGAARGAGKKGKSATEAFRRELFRDFSHLGKRNFYSYSRRAHKILPNSIIKKQLRRHFRVLIRKLLSNGR